MSFSGNGPRSSVLTLATFAAVLLLGLQSSSQSQDGARRITRINGFEAAEGEVLVKYRNEGARAAHAQIESRADAETVAVLTPRGVRHLRSRRLRTSQLLESLRTDPDVEYAEPNYVLRALATPNDPWFTRLWGLFNTGFNPIGGGGVPGADIDGPAAWDSTTGSRANVIGVIDTGVDYNHPDLAANMWSAPTTFQVTISGQTITCLAGTHGFNAITRTCDPMDDHYHGTHVAGTIGAVGNNSVGVTGVNWTASMMGLKFLDSGGSGWVSDAVAAIEFAIQAKAAFAASSGANVRILSNSWGGGGYSVSLLNAINAANASDMLFVAAAGNSSSNNDTSPHYPSSYPTVNMVTVASSTSSDTLSGFSNYGVSSVHLAAPGSAIYSTTPNNTYSTLQGTSMATPQVSGAAGLALAMCSLNTAQLKTLLLDNVDLVPAFSGNTVTGGRLNAAKMIQDCQYPAVSSLALSPSVASPQLPGTTVTWTAVASGGAGPYQYRWWVYNGTAWTAATGWQAGNTYAWTPASANSGYQVTAWVRSAWNSGALEAAGNQTFAIMPLVTSVTIAPNVTAPQGLGATVTWTASAAGGQPPYQYRWGVHNGTSWAFTTGWQSDNTYAWTPTSANASYQVMAHVRGSWNSGLREAYGLLAFAIKPAVTSVTLTPNVIAPQRIGTTVTWTATAAGGELPYQYRWWVYNGTAWTAATGWQAGNTYAWTPASTSSGSQVTAWVRSAWNSGAQEAAGNQTFAIKPVVTGVTIAPSVTAPRAPGATVTWAASPAGGEAPYQYQWAVYDGTVWTTTTGWQAGSSYAWTPTLANGGYQVQARVRSAWNSGALEATGTQAFAIQPMVTSVALTPSVASPQLPGTTVTWTAVPSGGAGPYQYRWWVYNGTAWTAVSGWQADNTYAWTPASASSGSQVTAWVRSAWNSGAQEAVGNQTFAIMPMVTSVTVTPNVVAPQPLGTTVTWTASPVGGQGPYQYQWWVYDGTTWTAATGWQSGNTYAWTPTSGNSAYQVQARVRGTWNSGVHEAAGTQAFAIRAMVTSVALTPSVASPQPPGTTVTWTAVPSGGAGPYQYRWWVYNGTAWTAATGWQSGNQYAWTPATANTQYQVQAGVRSVWNSGAQEAFGTKAFAIRPMVASVTIAPDVDGHRPPGTTITWTATPVGGEPPYQYSWALWDGTSWALMTNWRSENTWAWTPTLNNTTYLVMAQVNSAWNTAGDPAREAFIVGGFTTRSIVTNVTIAPSVTAPQAPGATITWTAAAVGGTAPYLYQWWVYDGSAWTMKTGWQTGNTYTWTPASANNGYVVQAWAKSNTNQGTLEAAGHQAFPIQ